MLSYEMKCSTGQNLLVYAQLVFFKVALALLTILSSSFAEAIAALAI